MLTLATEDRPLELVHASSSDDFGPILALESEGAFTPNERIVRYYQALLRFLTQKRKIPITKSMTHRDVARFLKTIGYPMSPVDRATSLFENAYYSGARLDESDTVDMSAVLSLIVGSQKMEAS